MKDKIICRCKEITEEKIKEVIRKGARDIDAVKRATGAGMGLCQGRTCTLLIARIISRELNIPLSQISLPTSRSPVRPIPTRVLSIKGGKNEKDRDKRVD